MRRGEFHQLPPTHIASAARTQTKLRPFGDPTDPANIGREPIRNTEFQDRKEPPPKASSEIEERRAFEDQ